MKTTTAATSTLKTAAKPATKRYEGFTAEKKPQ